MNPKITITVDANNKAIAAFDGIASVGAKVDVEVRGLPSGIVDFGAGDDWSGPSLRLRILDDDGNDIVRFPLEKKTSTKVVGGDQWTKTTASGADTYTNKTGTVVDFDTEGLREQFSGEAYDTSKSFGIILDSAVDKAEFAVGKIKIRQWLTASVDDPTVLPNWTEIQEKLNTVDAKVEKPAGSTTATIMITNTQGVTTTATVSDGVGGGDMKHSEFANVSTLSNATLNQVSAKINELIGLLKPAMPMIVATLCLCAFGDLGPTTPFGDVPPSSTLSQVVTAGGGGSAGGITTNDVNAIIASSNLCTVAAAQAMTNDNTIVRGVKNESTWDIRVTEALSADGAYEATVADELSGDLSWTKINTVEGRSNLDELLYEDFYMKSQIDGNAVTNGGAKAYADATFARSTTNYAGTIGMTFDYGSGSPIPVWGSQYARYAQQAVGASSSIFANRLQIGTIGNLTGLSFYQGQLVKSYNNSVVETNAWLSDVKTLSGRVYDFAHGSNFTKRVYAALTNVIQTLGGTVTNPPNFN